jgi:hypothetical protein
MKEVEHVWHRNRYRLIPSHQPCRAREGSRRMTALVNWFCHIGLALAVVTILAIGIIAAL